MAGVPMRGIVLSHPFCSPANKPVAHALLRAGLLHSVITSNDFTGKEFLRRWVGEGPYLSRQWQLPREKITLTRWPDLAGRALMKAGFRTVGRGGYDVTYLGHDAMAAMLLPRDAAAVYSYEDGAPWQFARARSLGLRRLLELPLGYYREVRERSAEARSHGRREFWAEPTWKIARKEREVELADILVCNSYYMAEATRRHMPQAHVVTLPHLMPADEFEARLVPQKSPLRLTYIGALSDRKGTLDLLQTWQHMRVPASAATLTLVGSVHLDPAQLAPYRDSFEHIAYLSRPQIAERLRQTDLFVFPSWCDGYGLVLGEALACGTPVLASCYSGAYQLVREGVEGWVYRPGTEQLRERLDTVIAQPQLLSAMRPAARQLAEDWSFRHRSEWIAATIGEALRARSA